MVDVFNINDLIYKVNVNTSADTSNQQTIRIWQTLTEKY